MGALWYKGLFYAIFRRKKFREMVIESRKELVKLGVLKPDGPSNSNRDFLFGAIDKMHTVNNLKAIENSLEKMKETDDVQSSNKT